MNLKTFLPKIKLGFTIALCLVWFAACFWGTKAIFFEDTAPLTSENTYKVTVPTDEITFEIKVINGWRGRSSSEQLLMYVGDDCYFIDWEISKAEGHERGDALKILQKLETESELTLTIFEDAFVVYQKQLVVDLRSPTTVYHDISIFRSKQKTERCVALLCIWVPILIFVAGLYFICALLLPPEYRKTFDKVDRVLNKSFERIMKKQKPKPPIVPPKHPPKEKRERNKDAIFRDED